MKRSKLVFVSHSIHWGGHNDGAMVEIVTSEDLKRVMRELVDKRESRIDGVWELELVEDVGESQ